MEIKSYNAQVYNRRKVRYIIFGFIIVSIIVISIINKNYVGALVICLFVGGYLFFSVHTTKKITIKTDESFLYLGDNSYERGNVQGFHFEMGKGSRSSHITFVIGGKNHTHTLNDTRKNIKKFVLGLTNYTALLKQINFSKSEKLARRFKL